MKKDAAGVVDLKYHMSDISVSSSLSADSRIFYQVYVDIALWGIEM